MWPNQKKTYEKLKIHFQTVISTHGFINTWHIPTFSHFYFYFDLKYLHNILRFWNGLFFSPQAYSNEMNSIGTQINPAGEN